MDDVVGQVMLPIGDVDLLPSDPVGPIALWHRFGADRPDVGAGLRLRQVHGARPFPADQLGQEDFFLGGCAVGLDRFDRALVEQRAQSKGQVGGLPHLLHRESHRPREALAPERRVKRHSIPTAVTVGVIALFEAVRGSNNAVFEHGPLPVADRVQGGDHIAGQLGRFL